MGGLGWEGDVPVTLAAGNESMGVKFRGKSGGGKQIIARLLIEMSMINVRAIMEGRVRTIDYLLFQVCVGTSRSGWGLHLGDGGEAHRSKTKKTARHWGCGNTVSTVKLAATS